MKNSENEVYFPSNSYCKVGKITLRSYFEEEASMTETDFEKENSESFDEALTEQSGS